MNEELRPYPDYKDSDLLWLGAVPAHWDVRRNGRLFAQRNETGFGSLPILEVSLKTGVRVRDMENMKRKQVMNDREKYKRAAKGDIAYNMMRMWQGALGAVPVDGLVSPAYVVARPYPGTETRYFSYLFRTAAYMAEVDGYSRGIVKDRNRLYWQDFKKMPSCYPPPDEQNAIADYLDANAVLVRKFIRNRRRLIDVLNEQKQAIINQAVTRGLDLDVPVKHSGIDWLGDVPAHWERRRLKFLVNNVNEQTASKQPDDIYIALEHVESWTGRITLSKEEVAFESQVKRFHANDVLFGKLRPYLAKVTRPQVKGVCVGEFLVLRVTEPSILQEFLEQKLRSKQVITIVNGSTFGAKMPRADWTFIGNLAITFPPSHDEQREILSRTAAETASLSAAIEHAQKQIDLIREYRTRLIADVVTGKLDVRYLALPQGSLDIDETTHIDAEEALDDELDGVEDGELAEEALNADD
jgi:type I restriction enzyme S subunit